MFGARVSSIKLPIDEQLKEMTVVYQNNQTYLKDEYYIDATFRLVAYRRSKAQIVIGQNSYKVSGYNGESCLHGGEDNFSNSFGK